MTLRRAVAVALTALACANAYLLPPQIGRTLPSRTSQLSRAAVVLKKGRAQGGTPKISLKRKKIYTARSKTDGLTQPSQRPKKRMPSLSSKRQWERHIALLDAGADATLPTSLGLTAKQLAATRPAFEGFQWV